MWLLLFFFNWVFAESSQSYQPMPITVRSGDSLQITGVHGRLKLIHDPRLKNLVLQINQRQQKSSPDWNLSVDRKGSVIEVEVFSVSNQELWKHELKKNQWPEFDIYLRGPSLPVRASWRQGEVDINRWNKDVDLLLLDGKLRIADTRGKIQIQGARLNMSVLRHEGEVNFTADVGQGIVEASKGILKIQLMDGGLQLRAFQGEFFWNSQRAVLDATNGQGQWNLVTNKGPIKVQMAGRSEVDIQSDSAPVKVAWHKGAAKAFLSSKTGLIKAPPIAKVTREEGIKKWLAQWGEGQLGQVFVKTQSGSILFSK